MESTIKQLEIQFEKADNDLQRVRLKLESEFQRTFSGDQVDPLQLLERLRVVRQQIEVLKHDHADLVENKREIMAKYLDFEPIRAQLDTLRRRAGLLPLHSEEADKAHAVLTGTYTEPVTDEVAEKDVEMDQPEVIRAPGSFSLITESEFDQVSSLIRQRCKLKTLNDLYERLYHLSKGREGDPIPMSEIADAGLKVTGVTGDAMINTLRSLQLIDKSKKGISLL